MWQKLCFIISFFILMSINCRDITGGHPAGSVELLWHKEIEDFTLANITLDEGFLYFLDHSQLLYRVSIAGKDFRTVNIQNGATFGLAPVYKNFLVAGTSVFGANTGAAHLYVFDKNTLSEKWSKHNFAWHVVPAIDKDRIYATDVDIIYAFDRDNGQLLWQKDIFGKNVYTPVIDGNNIYFATGATFQQDAYLYCLNKENGAVVFQDTLPYIASQAQFGGSGAGVGIWKDYIYVPAENRYLYCFDKHNGKLIWKFLADSPMETPARISDGILYTGSLNRTCYAINAETGALVWSYQDHGSIKRVPPAFYKNYVLFVSGAVLIFDKYSGKLIQNMTGRTGRFGYSDAIWAPDGKIYATGFEDETGKRYVFSYLFHE